MVRVIAKRCTPALVALALLAAGQVGARTPLLKLFGGEGFDSGVMSSNCPADAGQKCVVKVNVSINGGNGKCTVAAVDRPHVQRGQTVRWEIVSNETSLEFDEELGIAIVGNNVPGTPAASRPYFKPCTKASGTAFECVRKRGGGANDDEDQINRLAYGINMIYVHNNQRRLCYIDPLIISRD